MEKCKKVFSKEKFIEDVGQEEYEYFKSQHKEPYWVDVCDGLTEEEMNALGYAAISFWMMEVKQMSAKEMFEKLGYKITLKTKKTICYDINNEIERRAIWFIIPSKRFIIGAYQYTTLDELQAINKQVEELGWKYEEI